MAAEMFQALADTGRWEDVAYVFGGFMGASVVEAVAEGSMNYDAPSEAYGAIGILAAETGLSGQTKRMVQIGSGLHTADQLAARFGVKARLMGMV